MGDEEFKWSMEHLKMTLKAFLNVLLAVSHITKYLASICYSTFVHSINC
jgi:hypothetical protein